MDHFRQIIELVGMGIDEAGVLVVVLGDIIRTVMVRPTLEINGKLPWAQRVSASQNRT